MPARGSPTVPARLRWLVSDRHAALTPLRFTMPAISRPISRSSASGPRSPTMRPSHMTRMRSESAADLVELDGDEQDRLARLAHREELAVDELDRADIDAARRLADEQHGRVALHLAREHDLLLVAAGKVRRLQPAVRRADVVLLDLRARIVADGGDIRGAARSGTPGRRDSRATEFSHSSKAVTRPMRWRSSGTCARPRLAQRRRVAVRHHGERLAVEETLADGGVADAGKHLEQLRLAVAGDAGDADDLAGAHLERDFREAAHALRVDVAEILHLQQRRAAARPASSSTRSSTRRPTISSASSSGVVSAVSRVATISPRRMTETASVTAMISRSLWVIRMIVFSCALSCRRMRKR